MRISMIEADLSPRTGSRRFIYEVTSRLLAAGHEVKIFTNKLDRKTCFQQLLTLPIEVVLPEENFFNSLLKQTLLNRAVKYYWCQARLALETGKRAASFLPDIVLFHYTGERWLHPYFYHLKSSVAAVCLNVIPPFAVAEEPLRYQLYYYTMPQMSLARFSLFQMPYHLPPISLWEARSLEKLNLIIAHSKYVAERICHHKIGSSRRIEVIPLGVDHSQFYPTWEEEPFLLFLGRIHPSKNIELAIRALKNMATNQHLVIAGDVEERFLWYKNKLEQLAKKLNVSGKVEVRGSPSQKEVVRLMQRCSIFLFPSLVDTFGMAVLEAMACGKPVVACNAGGVPELMENCGFALEPDPKKWAKVIRKLLLKTHIRRRTSKRAFERSKLFTWDNVSNSLMLAMQNALAKKC